MAPPALRLSSLSAVPPEIFAAALNDFDIIRWITPLPFPYRLEDAQAFLRTAAQNPRSQAIWWHGHFAGGIATEGELGYWVAKPFWGQGVATAAARAMLERHFQTQDHILSSHHAGNTASARVLAKLGFRYTGAKLVTPRSLMLPVKCHQLRLERADYAGWDQKKD
jgi:GNAT superfamily N-acetyltransferase